MQGIWKSIVATLLLNAIPMIDAWALSSNTTQSANGSYTLTWSHSGPTDLYENKNGGGWSIITSNVSSKAISGKTDGVYGYYVQTWVPGPYTGMQKDKVLGPIYVTVAIKPGVPASIYNIPSTNDTGSFTVKWNAASGPVDEYVLEYQENGGNWKTVPGYISNVSVRSHPVSNLGDAIYRYRVSACNTVSNFRTCNTPRTSNNVIVANKPGVPSSITGVPNSDDDGGFTVSWGSASGSVDYYQLQQRIGTGSWKNVPGGTSSPHPISGLQDGTYTYKILACNKESTFTSCNERTSNSVIVANRPGTPSSITVPSTDDDGGFSVSWGTASGSVDYFQLQQKKGSNSWVTIPGVAGTSHPITNLDEGTYKYRVRACNTESTVTFCSTYRTSSDVLVIYPPSIPSSIAVPDLVTGFNVAWGAASGTITKYILEQKTNTGNWLQKQSSNLREYEATGIAGGNTYRFRVNACNDHYCSNGYRESGAVYVPYTAPVTDLSVQDVTPGESGYYSIGYDGIYTLSWELSGVYDEFILQESTDGGETWIGLNATGSTLGFDKPGNYTETPFEYLYRLQACNIDSCSQWKSITVLIQSYTRPGGPGAISLKSGPTTNGSYVLQWGASSGPEITHYTIQERELGEVSWGPEQKVGDALEYAFNGRPSGVTYQYRVKTCNTDPACSDYTSPFNVYVPYSAPSVPKNLSIDQQPTTAGNFLLSWDSSSGELDHYQIEHRTNGGNWQEYTTTNLAEVGITNAPSDNNEYRIKACNVDNCSEFSLLLVVYVPYPAPSTPGSLSLSVLPTADGNFSVSWSESSGRVDNYIVEIREGTSGSWTQVQNSPNTQVTVNDAMDGGHQIQVMACNVDNCSAFSAPLTVTIPSADWADLADASLVIPDQNFVLPSLLTHQNVGAVKGQGGVSGGAASYQIPIQTPPGRNEMQPRVTVNYSSQSGNGLLGVGWSLSAVSEISRCAQTVVHDGRNLAVQYNATNDRLCLDGQRLIPVSGSYGASGTEYRTEIDSFTRITQNGAFNGTATWFKAELKNGRVRYYGYDAASRHKADGVNEVQTWAITKEVDRTSTANSIIYQYASFGRGESLLANIYYTGSDGTIGNRRVEFVYEARNDKSSGYMAGGLSERTRRLKKINTYVETEKVREYSFSFHYSSASGRSLLDWAMECGFEGGAPICLPKTTFDWQDAPIEYSAPEPLKIAGQEVYKDILNIEEVVPRGDIDGNGSADFPGYNVNAEGQIVGPNNLMGLENCHLEVDVHRLKCIEADIDLDGKIDPFKIEGNRLYIDLTGDQSGYIDSGISLNIDAYFGQKDILHSIVDIDGDAYPDLVVSRFNNGRPAIKVYLHSGNRQNPYGGSAPQEIYQLAYRQNTPAGITPPYLPNESITFVGDMDGNGLPDFAVLTTYNEGYGGGLPSPLAKKYTSIPVAREIPVLTRQCLCPPITGPMMLCLRFSASLWTSIVTNFRISLCGTKG